MESMEMKIIVDKTTFIKLGTAMTKSSMIIIDVYMYLVLLLLFVWAMRSIYDSIRYIFLLAIPLILLIRYVVYQCGKVAILVGRVKKKRRQNNIKSKKIELITVFNNDCLVMKDAIEYENNIIVKLDYNSIRRLKETKGYYGLFVQTRGGLKRWFAHVGIVDKVAIDRLGKREEFVDYIMAKCPEGELTLKVLGERLNGAEKEYKKTLEEAFRNHYSNLGDMGYVFFADEHEGNITALHEVEVVGKVYASHYLKRKENGVVSYFCLWVQSVTDIVPLCFDEHCIKSQKSLILPRISPTNKDEELDLVGVFAVSRNTRFSQVLGRRPLYGVSHDHKIRGLVINGQPVETVIETNIDGRKCFFWYYSDFPAFYGTAGEITIEKEE